MKSHEPFDTIDIQEKNAMICRFMGGEIIPFQMPWSVVNTWQKCEVQSINGVDPNTNLLTFHSDWSHIMQVWEKIISLDESHLTTPIKRDRLIIDRLEINKSSILLCCEKWEEGEYYKKMHSCNHIFHFYKKELYTTETPDCKNMKEVYYKSIINFISWYNETLR